MHEWCGHIIIPLGQNAFHPCRCRRNTKQPAKQWMQISVVLARKEVRVFIISEISDLILFTFHNLNDKCNIIMRHYARIIIAFYSALQCSHCKRCTSYGISVHLSVRPSVTCWYCVKTTACSTVQFAPSDSKMCLVL